jgi:transglutaminase-like putative cysteine protease
MRRLVLEGRSDPRVGQYADRVIASSPHLHPVEALFRHVQSMPYRFDEEILSGLGYESDTSELLQGAPFQIEKALREGPQSVEGDCDDRAILLQSLLESKGIPTRFVLVRGPGRVDYSHVYSEALVGGVWIPLDTIMDGRDGRPFFGPGDEARAPLARDRFAVGVNEEPNRLSPLALLLVAALLFWRS